MSKTAPVSVRLEAALNDQVAAIAAALDRPKSWVIEQAVRDFVTVQDWHWPPSTRGSRLRMRRASPGMTMWSHWSGRGEDPTGCPCRDADSPDRACLARP